MVELPAHNDRGDSAVIESGDWVLVHERWRRGHGLDVGVVYRYGGGGADSLDDYRGEFEGYLG